MAQQGPEEAPAAEAPPAEDAPRKKQKKPKLSKEERARRKLLAEMELGKRLMREQFLREIALTNKSLKRGKVRWEGIRKTIKLKEFREDIHEWAEKAEYLLSKKDEKINLLVKNLEETDELNERSFADHIDKLEYLSRSHSALISTATDLYEKESLDMIEDFLLEMERSEEMRERIRTNNENILHSVNVVTKDKLKQNYERYMDIKFSKATEEVERRYKVRDQIAKRMRELQDQLINFIKTLQGDLVDVHKTKKFEYFMQRQRNYVQESAKLCDIEQATRKAIWDLQTELLNIETDFSKKIQGLKLQQVYFFEVKAIIKNTIEKNKRDTHEKMKTDASASYWVIKKLREYVKRGELLISLSACCQKYKTQKEKVIRYEDDFNPIKALRDFPFDLHKLLDVSEEELAELMDAMKNFWRRVSHARFHNLLLNEEKRKLIAENNKYIFIIKSMKKSDDIAYILEAMEIKPL